MPLTKALAMTIGTAAAAATDTQARLMNGRCMVIAQQVLGAMPAQVPAVTSRYIALRWYTPGNDQLSHVAVWLFEGGAAFVVDAAWQQYPFVAKFEKYTTSKSRKYRDFTMTDSRNRADNKATDPATRVYVGAPDEWQRMVEGWNNVRAGSIVRKVFEDQAAASDWMAFRA